MHLIDLISKYGYIVFFETVLDGEHSEKVLKNPWAIFFSKELP